MNITINILDSLGNIIPSTINATVEGTPFTNTFTGAISDDTLIDIVVPSTGAYQGYTESIRGYKEDITVNILLRDLLSPSSPEYLKPIHNILSIRNPYTGSYDFYNTTSPVGKSYWYINDVEFGTGNTYTHSFKSSGEHSVKVQTVVEDESCITLWNIITGSITVGNTVIRDVNSTSYYLSLDTAYNQVVEDSFPDITVEFNSVSSLRNDDTYALGDLINFRVGINASLLETYLFNVVVDSPSGESIIEETLDNQSISDLANIYNTLYSFNSNVQGKHRLVVTIINQQTNQTSYKDFFIYIGSVITIDYVTCNTYKITHQGFNYPPVNITITNHATDKVLNDTIITLSPDKSIEVELSEGIGIYRVESSIQTSLITKSWFNVINTFCQIEDCITDYITSLLCEGCDTSKNVDEYLYDYMKFHSLIHTYHSKLQKEFGYNNVYTGFDIDKLNSFTEIQDIINQLSYICSCSAWAVTEDAGCGQTVDPKATKGGCGCGGGCGGC